MDTSSNQKIDKYERNKDTQSDSDKSEVDRILNRWDQLDTASTNWKTHWQECYENIVPRKEDVVGTRMPGDRRNSDIYDTTAVLANEMLASALHGMLTNPENRFFELTFGDPRLDEDTSVQAWAQDTASLMFRTLNNTNFQTEIYEIYIDLGAIGTACLYMGEHDKNIIHFSARALKEIRIDENNLGLIDVVYRTFKYRAYQLVEEFGEDNLSGDVLRMRDKNSQDQIDVIHAVEPLSDKNARGHLFKSTTVLKSQKYIVKKSGYNEFPYAVPRWSKTSGEIYGRGPGMSMLPDIMMLNSMMLTVIQGAQMTVNPPLMVHDDGVIGVVRLTPGGLTTVRPGDDVIKPLITDARIDFGQKMLEDVRSRIRAGFYVDQFQLAQGPQKTAEEVRQEVEQKLRLMGPVLGRQHFELLRPMISRLFWIMYRKQLLPPMPEKIQGKRMDVRYSSSIARAQRMMDGQNIIRAGQILDPLFNIRPESKDLLNADRIVREVWSIYGNKHSLLLDDRELDQYRKKQQKAAAEMKQKMDEQHQAETLGKTAPMVSAIQKGQQANVPQ